MTELSQNIKPVILDLPFPAVRNISARRVRSGPLRLAQFGHIGPNRRILEILDVLGSLRDKLAFRFDIIGQVWDPVQIRRKIEANGLAGDVKIHGYLPEARLNELISEAHLIFNLRYPTMGEASGSQLRIWSRATCAVVSDHGWYTFLPDNTVLKLPINSNNEREELRRILLRIEGDRASFEKIGRAGFARLKMNHVPADYVRAICMICDQISNLSQKLVHCRVPQKYRL